MKYVRYIALYAIPAAVLSGAHIAFAQTPFQNPVSANSIQELVSQALKVMVMVALPIIGLFVVYSGFMFVFAQGNQEALQKAKRNFLFVILGAILILGAWVIASILGNTVSQLTR